MSLLVFLLSVSNISRNETECTAEEIVREAISNNEDEREEAELKLLEQRDSVEESESQEEKDYKAEFFELLDEVSAESFCYYVIQ